MWLVTTRPAWRVALSKAGCNSTSYLLNNENDPLPNIGRWCISVCILMTGRALERTMLTKFAQEPRLQNARMGVAHCEVLLEQSLIQFAAL